MVAPPSREYSAGQASTTPNQYIDGDGDSGGSDGVM